MAPRRGAAQKRKAAAKRKIVSLKFSDPENVQKLQTIVGSYFESNVTSSATSPGRGKDEKPTNVNPNTMPPIIDRSGRKTRKWAKQPKEIKSFTGFKTFFKSWIGGEESDYNKKPKETKAIKLEAK